MTARYVGSGGDNHGERLSRIEERLRIVEGWVEISRNFHTEAHDFFTRQDERAKQREIQEKREKEDQARKDKEEEKKDRRRARIHFWWLSLLSGLILTFFGWMLNWADHFEQRHHISQSPQQSLSQPQQNFNAKDQ